MQMLQMTQIRVGHSKTKQIKQETQILKVQNVQPFRRILLCKAWTTRKRDELSSRATKPKSRCQINFRQSHLAWTYLNTGFCGICNRWLHFCFVNFCSCLSGTLSSHRFGPTKFITYTVLWCWCWSSSVSWQFVSPSFARTSFLMLRTTDGGCSYGTSLVYHLIDKLSIRQIITCPRSLFTLFLSLLGSGQVSSLRHPLQFMYTCTPFTTISSKLSKFQVSFKA